MDEAAILMDRPPGGWNDLVTNQSLDRRLVELETRTDLKLDAMKHELTATMEREFRAQTWRLTTALLSSMAVLIAVVGALITVAKF